MIRRPPRSTLDRSSAASDVYKRQLISYTVVSVGDLTKPISNDHKIVSSANYNQVKKNPDEMKKIVSDFINDGGFIINENGTYMACLLYTSPSPRDRTRSRMPSFS